MFAISVGLNIRAWKLVRGIQVLQNQKLNRLFVQSVAHHIDVG